MQSLLYRLVLRYVLALFDMSLTITWAAAGCDSASPYPADYGSRTNMTRQRLIFRNFVTALLAAGAANSTFP